MSVTAKTIPGETVSSTSLSHSLASRDRKSVWHPFTQHGLNEELLVVTRAVGAYLYLSDGTKLLDAISSWWCNLHGHGHPELVEVASRQFAKLDHVLFAGCTHEPAVELAEALLEATSRKFDRVFYSDNGSTSVEVALKMAVQWWYNQGKSRSTIIALENAYHGDTFGAMATGARGIFSAPFNSMMFDVSYISTAGSSEDIEKLRSLVASDNIAAFIYEPLVQGAGGMKMYAEDALNSYLSICKEYKIPCIADEVMTGFGRTGPLFSSLTLQHSPDILCLSKGLTNGTMPLSATLCTARIYDEFLSRDHTRTFFHGHTFTGNPIACSVALKSLELTMTKDCENQRAQITEQNRQCSEQLAQYGSVLNPRFQGTILAFDLQTNDETSYTNSAKTKIMEFFRAKSILIRPLGNTIYCMPPFCTNPTDLKEAHEAILSFVKEV
jgi:adenosylmethionine-8-amino-7-oxononanoate aminotransferase